MSDSSSLLAGLSDKTKEQQHLLAVLGMWAKVKEQGIDPDSVKAMAFDPARLSVTERNRLRRRGAVLGMGTFSNSNPYGWPVSRDDEGRAVIQPLKFNVAVLHDGSRITLSPEIDRP